MHSAWCKTKFNVKLTCQSSRSTKHCPWIEVICKPETVKTDQTLMNVAASTRKYTRIYWPRSLIRQARTNVVYMHTTEMIKSYTSHDDRAAHGVCVHAWNDKVTFHLIYIMLCSVKYHCNLVNEFQNEIIIISINTVQTIKLVKFSSHIV
jgi:hypothetical protein